MYYIHTLSMTETGINNTDLKNLIIRKKIHWDRCIPLQEEMYRVPTPPKDPKPASPRGRGHAAGPKMPASTKPKSK